MTRVGFVGLGNMGGPMAANLVSGGCEVKVFDLLPELINGVAGASGCASAAEAAQDVDVFVSMLPAGRHVRGLYVGDGDNPGLLSIMSPDTLIIDCSTIDPDSARAVAEAAAAQGIAMIDAPVSGGTAGAQNGTLTFIVGGEPAAFERAQAVLNIMGGNIFHAGGAGAGQVAKICNNMMLAILMTGTAEALSLGVDNGLDPAVLSEIMKVSSGGNWALNVYNPYPGVMPDVPSSRGYEGGFLVDLMRKDLGLALQTAQSTESAIPMGSLAQNLYEVHRQVNDAGRLDFSSIQWLFKPELKG